LSSVTRVDQAVLQLRLQLQRLARERARCSTGAHSVDSPPLQRLRQARSTGGLGEEEFRRKFVRALLTEELGEELGNQPEFDRISNEVARMLSEDEDTNALVEAAIRQLGMAAG